MNPKRTVNSADKLIYFLLLLVSFVVYGNSIRNDYGFDDSYVVTANKNVQKGVAGIEDILQMPYAQFGDIKLDYRPIVLVSFALEHQFFNDNPHISHFINVLLYALCLLVLYRVLIVVFHLNKEYAFLPFLITLFFAVHPIHTEIVNSLKNRDELFVVLFGMLFILYGYYYYTKATGRWKYALISLFFLTLTLMSKISGLIFVGLFIPLCFFNDFFKGKKWNYIFLLICLLMVVRGVMRAFEGLNRASTIFENPLADNKSLLIALGTSSNVMLYHIKMLLIPSPLRFYYGANMFPVVGLTHPFALISFVLHLSLLIYGIIRFFKKDRVGLFILCYFVAVSIYSNFPIPYTSMFAERALFLSSLWFIVIIAVVLCRGWIKYQSEFNFPLLKNAFLIALVALFGVYSYMTINRNFLWKNTLTLMSHDIQSLQNSILANFIYANNLKYESKVAKDKTAATALATSAVYYYNQAIGLQPNYPEFYFKLGSTYRYNLNNLDSAERHFKNAVLIDTLYADAKYELSKLYFDKQDYRRSTYFFKQTYELKPTDSMTLFYYAQSAANSGDLVTCYKINQEFLKLYPQLPYPYLNLGTYYSTILKDDSAVVYFDKAINLGYRETELLNKLAYYFEQKGNLEKAVYYRKLN
jgi:tetratricopeptide (TPR) repeat protein